MFCEKSAIALCQAPINPTSGVVYGVSWNILQNTGELRVKFEVYRLKQNLKAIEEHKDRHVGNVIE